VQQADARRWAISQAIAVNMHLASGEEPFLAEDFLGTGDRARRKMEREMSKREAARLNREMEQKITVGVKAEDLDLPDWAR
jgi:flagellar motor switch protein FliG